MAEATPLGRTLDGDVGAHWPDEVDPDGERLSSVPENGVVEGGGLPAIAAEAPFFDGFSEQH